MMCPFPKAAALAVQLVRVRAMGLWGAESSLAYHATAESS